MAKKAKIFSNAFQLAITRIFVAIMTPMVLRFCLNLSNIVLKPFLQTSDNTKQGLQKEDFRFHLHLSTKI